ncbi:hypothetical protein PENTCL1PPCAC_9698, partial [Pristionchus entomophagus]
LQMMDTGGSAVRSPYDAQQPSTSTSTSSSHSHWFESASGQSSHFGTLPEATPMELHALQQLQLPPQQQPQQAGSIAMTGGRAMRQQLAAMRLANTAEWASGGVATGAAAPPVPASPSRTPSLLSLQSEASCLSQMTAFSGMSCMTGLTVRTDYSQAELDRVARDKQLRQSPSVAAAACSTASSLLQPDDETQEERRIRQVVIGGRPEEVFMWTANDQSKADPLFRAYRKMVLRIYAKQDQPLPDRPGAVKMLKLLAGHYQERMRKILEDLWMDIQDFGGKVRTDALHSLYDCASATPESLASLLRHPPKARLNKPEFSIRDIVQCVDPRGDDSVAAARILVRLAEPQLRYEDIRKRGITEDGLRRLLFAVLHERDVAPNKRIVLLEALKKYNKKAVFIQEGGVPSILRFLNKEADENGSAPAPDTLVRVEKEEPLLHHVLCFLRSLVVPRSGRGGGQAAAGGLVSSSRSNREAFVAELAKHNAVQILSGWLDHGSSRLLHEVAHTLAALSTARQLVGKDLSVAIRRVIQLLGTDDPTFTGSLVTFVRNVARLSTAHKKSAVDSGLCGELLQILNKWAVATERDQRARHDRWHIPLLFAAVESLDALTADDDQGVHNTAIKALLKSREAVPILLRVATFDFLYTEIRSSPDAQSRNVAYDAAFDALPPEARIAELRSKNHALNVLLRMCMSVQNVASLNLSTVQDPLHGEPLVVMLWRRLWDMYRQVFLLSTRASRTGRGVSEAEVAPIQATVQTTSHLSAVLYADPACYAQVLSLVGVAREAPDGTQPMLNPFKLLSTPLPNLSLAVLELVDALMNFFRRHAVQTHKHPMAVWLQPRARDDGGDYKQQFFQAVLQLQGGGWISGDIAQRMDNYFNECMGTHSPSFTPGGFTHAPHAVHHPYAPQLMPHAGYQQ